MAEKELLVLMGGLVMGVLHQDQHGQTHFSYDTDWSSRLGTTPLSLSMPQAAQNHPHRRVDPFLRGLLPDNDTVVERWGRRFGVSANNPFALLQHVGEDVAGAAQFVHPDRLDGALSPGGVEPVDEGYIANRLRTLRGDRSAWDDAHAPGEFSLAGAQAKFALARMPNGTWGIPTGRSATTHIFKPPLPYLSDQEVNEHLCLRAAHHLGLQTASSEVMRFGDEAAIVLERYDRSILANGLITRRHQEDFCQALGVHPGRKYQRGEGGPGIVRMMGVLREHQSPTQLRQSSRHLIKALAYNWIIYGPDAHAKNYSLLLDGDEVSLSPLYDISSVATYPDRYDLRHMAMAMSVNGKYENRLVTGSDWRALASELDLDEDDVSEWVYDVASGATEALATAIEDEQEWIRDLPTTHALLTGVTTNSTSVLQVIDPPIRLTEPKPLVSRGKPFVGRYQKKDGTWVNGYRNPRYGP